MASPHAPKSPWSPSVDPSTDQENVSESWRKDGSATKKPLSRGVTPRNFYRRPRPGSDVVDRLHAEAQQSRVKMERQKISQQLELRRSAFKGVTSLRTWPLQERALTHFRQLLYAHVNSTGSEAAAATTTLVVGEAMTSSSSSSSGLSAAEPKRPLRNLLLSPAKSRLKVQFQQEFLAERAKPRPQSPTSFEAALWSMEPRIFSSERSKTGKRKYVVGELGRFIDHYWRKTDARHRHYYELIGENTPCRLYFDLEFNKAVNPLVDATTAEQLLDDFFAELAEEISTVFRLSLERSSVVDLDSSTDIKFSRHWIVHTPRLFSHTTAVGAFVQAFISRLADEQATGQLMARRPVLAQHLMVDNDKGEQTCFVDLGVYTRNRLFRLMGSTKFGKPPSAALRLADANQFPFPRGFDNSCFYLPLMSGNSKAPSSPGEDADNVEKQVDEFVAKTDWTLHAEALALTLVIPMNATKIDYPLLPYKEEDEKIAAKPVRLAPSAKKASSQIIYGPSPFPALDEFVLSTLATRGDSQGSIRAWSIDSEESRSIRITYQMSRNRWCECVGRAHKSNNIFWTVDLRAFECVQGCHDPECRAKQFRGTHVALPEPVREAVEETLFEEAMAAADERELVRQVRPSPAKSDYNFEDESFEQALANLQIDEGKLIDASGVSGKDPPLTRMASAENAPSGELLSMSTLPDEYERNATKYDAPTLLSDDALLDAVLTHPDLFP